MWQLTSGLLTEENIPATVYHLGLIKAYGTDIYEWEPETLWLELKDDYGVEPSEEVKDKIQAVLSVNQIDAFSKDCIPFRSVILALNNTDPQFEYATPIDPAEIAWGLAEISRNCNYQPEYSDDVKEFVSLCLAGNHYLGVPSEIAKYINLDYTPDVDTRISSLPEVQEAWKLKKNRVKAFVLLNDGILKKALKP